MHPTPHDTVAAFAKAAAQTIAAAIMSFFICFVSFLTPRMSMTFFASLNTVLSNPAVQSPFAGLNPYFAIRSLMACGALILSETLFGKVQRKPSPGLISKSETAVSFVVVAVVFL